MRDEVEDVFFEVGSGATDAVILSWRIISGQRQAQLGCAHGTADGDKHLSASGQMRVVGLRSIDQRGGIEVTIVVLDELVIGGILTQISPTFSLSLMAQSSMNKRKPASISSTARAGTRPWGYLVLYGYERRNSQFDGI